MSNYGFEYDSEKGFTKEQREIVFVEATKTIEKGEPSELLSGAYYDRGILYIERNDYDKAIEDYSNAIKLDFCHLYAAYYNRGLAYFRKNLYDAALNDLNTALSLKPDDEDTKVMIKQTSEIIEHPGNIINCFA
jgi:tetratricopeptide (TPR) repeat protein